jgi:succinate dehydrogenase / fumarate reductase, cytochrome b subunit
MSTASNTTTLSEPSTRPLLWSRIGSLVSFLPLGVWTVNHLWDNLAAFEGAQAWEKAVTHYPHPFGHYFTLVVVLIPLAIHTVWGLQRLFSFTPNNARYPTVRNARYILQRLSGAGLLFFIGAHLWLAMLQPRLVKGHSETFADIASHMRHHPPTLVVYLLGIAGIGYHLANGLSGLAFTWGLTSGRDSFKRFDWVTAVSFVVFSAMGLLAIYALWSAGANFPPVES